MSPRLTDSLADGRPARSLYATSALLSSYGCAERLAPDLCWMAQHLASGDAARIIGQAIQFDVGRIPGQTP
jgi:hypothetical protein